MLETSYAWLDHKLAGRHWLPAASSASPTVLPRRPWSTPICTYRIPPDCVYVIAYRRRLLARPSFARECRCGRTARTFHWVRLRRD
ncbi:Glutathione S-transferase OS=Rhodanobacter lindaniclasticus OX=75310 GN=B1991_01050 PE=4 SV=1 [Rhodanobacter lindaniclasticus]